MKSRKDSIMSEINEDVGMLLIESDFNKMKKILL